jgi:hypothetical protein
MTFLKHQPPAAFDRSKPEEPVRARSDKDAQILAFVHKLARGGKPSHLIVCAEARRVTCPRCGVGVGVVCGPDFGDGDGPLLIGSHNFEGRA